MLFRNFNVCLPPLAVQKYLPFSPTVLRNHDGTTLPNSCNCKFNVDLIPNSHHPPQHLHTQRSPERCMYKSYTSTNVVRTRFQHLLYSSDEFALLSQCSYFGLSNLDYVHVYVGGNTDGGESATPFSLNGSSCRNHSWKLTRCP